MDLRGNASYSRVRGWSPEASPEATTLSRPASRVTDDGALVQKTRQLAAAWLSADDLHSTKSAVKRETLLLAKLPGGKITETQGRAVVRLIGPDDIGDGCFQAVFDPNSSLLRLDIAFARRR